ncbi:hypothetical protein FUAX_24420 [Fulvitalea axinellae]|uniref:Uncharacterized protein n=1 Tax=Fulvitalea axinellae TaxID=1182444 RepID=A0AAU9CL36_9BACT|nr:hypothetical protein FUAX_24420 [Fulvitalea axinellae]
MKQRIAKEILWLLGALIGAVPVAFLFLELLDLTTQGEQPTVDERVFFSQLFIIGYVIGMISIYVIRIVRFAIIGVVSPPVKETEKSKP